MLYQISNGTVSVGGELILSHIDFEIRGNEKIAVVGKNGAGKTTLLNLVAGKLSLDRDDRREGAGIRCSRRLTVGMLSQQAFKDGNRTVEEELLEACPCRDTFERERFEYEREYDTLFTGFGLPKEDKKKRISQFSGGEQTKIALIRLLLEKPDILLLDEPTNHLDIDSIQWLEEFLISNGKAVVVISHDRTFVDNITTRTIEVTMGRIYDYKVNYSKYLELRKDRQAQQQKAYDEQQKMIAETKDFIERFKGTYSKTLQVQSRVKMLEKLELIEVDEEDTSALRLKFPPSPRSGSYPVIAQELSKYYGDHLVFKEAGFTIQRGEKVAFVGRNGEGKSTLVKCIMGEITDYTGKLTLGHNVQIGYFAQNQASLLDEELTVFQTVDDVTPSELKSNTKNLLGAFMFSGDDIDKKVKVLSGGERTRLAMIKLLLQPVNLLILDEPTNHLDLKTKDILKNALIDFDGTLIVVSHDRDFLNGLAQKVYEFGNGKVTEHLEDINGFLRKKKMENLREIESRKS